MGVDPIGHARWFVRERGTPITLHSFDKTDGSNPGDRMVQIGDSNSYGSTFYGGNLTECFGVGCGMIFEMTPGER